LSIVFPRGTPPTIVEKQNDAPTLDLAHTTLHSRFDENISATALEATQGQMDGFFSQLTYKCHLEELASVGD